MNMVVGAVAASPATALQAGNFEDDGVISLCERYRAIQQEHDEAWERYKQISDRVDAEMPLPDPSIVHSPENAALGIKAPDGYSVLHDVIEPHAIRSALWHVEPSTITIVKEAPGVRKIIEHDVPQPLSSAEQLKHDKLTKMLKLSTNYFKERKRQLDAALGSSNEEREALTDQRCDDQREIADTLCGTPARAPEGILAKVELYRLDPDYFDCRGLTESVFCDIERLFRKGA
jgi:hypothetical protein